MFAVLLLPQFYLQAVLRWQETLWAEPVAVVDDSTAKGTILEITPPAAAAGVCLGMASSQALARCGALQLLPRSDSQEQNAGAALLEVAGALSPRVEATGDGLCTVDLRQAKIPDWTLWADQVIAHLAELRLTARVGIAINPDLALLAARQAAPVLVVQNTGAFVAGVAMSEVDVPPELSLVLRDWGISHLGDLTRVPQSELIDRLGPKAGQLWQRAAGQSERLLRVITPPEGFAEAFEFDYEVDTVEPLLFLLRRFLDQLTLRLTGSYRVAARMTLVLALETSAFSEDEAPSEYSRVFTIPAPTADPEILFRILHTHLEDLELTQRPIGIRLMIEPVIPGNQQLRLFESPLRDPNRFGETLARLAALVGADRVGVPVMEATHRPDSFRLVEPEFGNDEDSPPENVESQALGLPLRRYRPPFSAQVNLVRQTPAHVFSEKIHGEIVDIAGPYRVSGGWWEKEAWRAEEWDVEMSDGGLYRLSRQNDSWFVEGCYDEQAF